MNISRRNALGVGALSLLAACSGTGSLTQSQFDQAKAYLDAGAGAIMAAAQAYLAGPPVPSMANAALVQEGLAALEKVKISLDATTLPTDWKSTALEALAIMQQLNPIVAAFEGPAAPYVTLAIAVVTAFVNSLPAPPAAPPTPPAALTRAAAKYHPHER